MQRTLPTTWAQEGDSILCADGQVRTIRTRTLRSPRKGDRTGWMDFAYYDGTAETLSVAGTIRLCATPVAPEPQALTCYSSRCEQAAIGRAIMIRGSAKRDPFTVLVCADHARALERDGKEILELEGPGVNQSLTPAAPSTRKHAQAVTQSEWSGEQWDDKQEAMRDYARDLAERVNERRQS